MWDFIEDYFGAILIIVASLLISLVVWLAIKEQQEWDEFSSTHECKLERIEKGDLIPITTIGANGQVGISYIVESDKKCYACNDGVTYCR